jgi:hypothetical protein
VAPNATVPTCEYCGERVEDEEALLSHLAAEHEAELGPIDRRRVEDRPNPSTDGVPTVLYVAVVLVGLLAVLLIALALGATF